MNSITYERVVYSEAGKKIIEALELEKIETSETFNTNLLHFLSTICTYEEEERKVLPNILLGNNVLKIVQTIPSITIIKIGTGDKDGNKMLKFLKAIIPFCNNGWLVYLNIFGEQIEYGILRAFNGLLSVPFTELLFGEFDGGEDFQTEDLFRNEEEDTPNGLLFFTVLGKAEIYLRGLKQQPQIIDLRFIQQSSNSHDSAILDLVEDMTLELNEKHKSDVKVMCHKILRQTLQRVHGTICVIVKKGTILSDLELFKDDGLILENPLDIANFAIEALQENNAIFTEKYYAISSLLLEMMNIDGLTIVDSAGRIIAYNVFVNSPQQGLRENTQGGARTRAYQTILQANHEKILGAYFQSQDGHAVYERRNIE